MNDPLFGCSPKWVDTVAKYAAFHEDARARLAARDPARPPPTVIVYSCFETRDSDDRVGDDCGGYADRMFGVEHLLITAMLHDAAFFIDWSVGQLHDPRAGRLQLLPLVLHSPFWNLTYDPLLVLGPQPNPLPPRNMTELPDTYVTMGCPDHNGPCPLMQPDVMATHFSRPVNFARLNKGPHRYVSPAVATAMAEKLGLPPESAGSCMLRALVRPNPSIVEGARPLALRLLDPATPHVSLHVRTGDRPMHDVGPRDPEEGVGDKYWVCALSLAKSLSVGGASGRVFFSTDAYGYKGEAVTEYGSGVVTVYDVKPWHTSRMALFWDGHIARKTAHMPLPQERLRVAFTEWWLMTLCE